jgi:hypothetical protein
MHFLFTPSHPCTIATGLRRVAGALLLAAVAATGASAAPAPTPADGPRETVLRGEVVETACFVIGARRGEGHRQCALMGARAGEGLGVLDDQTKLLYEVVLDLTSGPQPNPLLPFIAEKVEVRGTAIERGGINGIVVRQVKGIGPPRKR